MSCVKLKLKLNIKILLKVVFRFVLAAVSLLGHNSSTMTMPITCVWQVIDYDAHLDDVTNRLIMKLVDVVIEDALERGASQRQAQSLMDKRSGLRKCFFHAVNCW